LDFLGRRSQAPRVPKVAADRKDRDYGKDQQKNEHFNRHQRPANGVLWLGM
jgi:hypothetical protein